MTRDAHLAAVPDASNGATPLCDLSAERQVLGIVMVEPSTFAETADHVTAADFYRGAHRTIFEAIQTSHASDQAVDSRVVADVLERDGTLDGVGGHLMLADIVADVGSTSNAVYYADKVADLARRRRIIGQAHQLAADVVDLGIDVDDVLHKRVDGILANRAGRGVITVDDFTDDLWDLWEHGAKSRGFETGWRSVDYGWRPSSGQLVIVAGIPGHGKSAWLDALLGNLSVLHGWRHAMWAPESSPYESHASRLIAAHLGAPFTRAGISEQRMIQGEAWLRDHFAWVDPDMHDTIPAILAQIRAVHGRRPIHSFVIDPWTEIDHTRDKGVREDEFISRELTRIRRFARRNALVAFVAVHPKQIEVNRSTGVFPVPNTSDLHGGSVWRKKADALLVVWRDEQGHARAKSDTDLHVQKIRRNNVDGVMGATVTLKFDISTYRYREETSSGVPVAEDPRFADS